MQVAKVWQQAVSFRWNSYPKTYLSYKSQCDDGDKLKGRLIRAHHNETSHQARILILGNAFDMRPMETICLEVIGDEVDCLSSGSPSSYTFAAGTSGVSYPPGGAFASAVDKEGNLLLFGGWDDSADDVRRLSYRGSTSQRLDWKAYTETTLWVRLPHVSFLRCFAAATSSLLGDIILTGGSDSPYRGATVYDDVIAFRASDERFESPLRLPAMLERRAGHAAVTLFDGSVAVLGGYAGGADYLRSVGRLDAASERWLPLPSMSVPRSGFACSIGEGGAMYVAGGSPDGSHGHSSAERLDLRVGRWEALPHMHFRRGYTAGCVGNRGCLYVSGGLDGGPRQASLEIFDPRMNCWRSGACIYRDDKLARTAHVMHFIPQ